jgi:hypothetical protein
MSPDGTSGGIRSKRVVNNDCKDQNRATSEPGRGARYEPISCKTLKKSIFEMSCLSCWKKAELLKKGGKQTSLDFIKKKK